MTNNPTGQGKIKHCAELKRYNQRRGLLNRLDCELELTDDIDRLERILWLMARVRNQGTVFTDLEKVQE